MHRYNLTMTIDGHLVTIGSQSYLLPHRIKNFAGNAVFDTCIWGDRWITYSTPPRCNLLFVFHILIIAVKIKNHVIAGMLINNISPTAKQSVSIQI